MSGKLTQKLKEDLKREFVEGYLEKNKRIYPSIEMLGKKYNIPRPTMYRHAKKDDWQKAKNRFHSKVEEKITESRVATAVEKSKQLDDNSMQIAQALLVTCGRKLQKAIDHERQYPNSELYSSSELRDLSSVAINAQKIGKLALGEASEISKVSADVTIPESFREIISTLDEVAEERSTRANHTIQ